MTKITKLTIAAIILTLIDAVCTATGVTIGAITEGNAIWRNFMHLYPALAALTATVLTCSLLAIVYACKDRVRFVAPLLSLVVAVKLCIVGMHLVWIIAVK